MQHESRLALLLLALAGVAINGLAPANATGAQSHNRERLTDWTAVSTTAMGITGDVQVGEHEMIINETHRYRITKIRNLTAREVGETKELTADSTLQEWVLYKIDIPASTKLNNGNTICGHQSATRVIISRGPAYGAEELSLIFFPGSREPFFEGWRESQSGVCGSFGYTHN